VEFVLRVTLKIDDDHHQAVARSRLTVTHGDTPIRLFCGDGGAAESLSCGDTRPIVPGCTVELAGDAGRFVVRRDFDPSPPLVGASSGGGGVNYLFYSNALRCRPLRMFVEEFHAVHSRDYGFLEDSHSFIQWLFPLYVDSGMNYRAEKLEHDEARLMRRDPSIARRVVASYSMMLDFYGFVLADETTGRVAPSPNADHREQRFCNLNYSFHNNLRITRIITSLGHLGFRRWRAPLVEALRREIGTVDRPGPLFSCSRSCEDYWLPLLAPTTKSYAEKTQEIERDDSEESVFFSLRH
jgi:hypothetical protein